MKKLKKMKKMGTKVEVFVRLAISLAAALALMGVLSCDDGTGVTQTEEQWKSAPGVSGITVTYYAAVQAVMNENNEVTQYGRHSQIEATFTAPAGEAYEYYFYFKKEGDPLIARIYNMSWWPTESATNKFATYYSGGLDPWWRQLAPAGGNEELWWRADQNYYDWSGYRLYLPSGRYQLGVRTVSPYASEEASSIVWSAATQLGESH